jgi:hypothetical protein
VSETKDNDSEEDTPEDGTRPFIHGRHTCDSCLATPIIGNRYHSTNLQDYDLCENCFKNYKGKEIVFEVAELERDRGFQERWQRRWDRAQTMMSRRGRFAGRGARGLRGKRFGNNGPRPFGRVAHGHPAPSPPPPPHHCMPPPPHHSPFGPGFHHQFHHLGPHVAPHIHNATNGLSSEFDSALKEAIRRSLKDIGPKEVEINKKSEAPVHQTAPVEPSQGDVIDLTNGDDDSDDGAVQPTAPVKPSAPSEEDINESYIKKVIIDSEKTKKDPPVVETVTDEEVNDIPRSVEIVHSDDDKSTLDADGSKGTPDDFTLEGADADAIENSMDTESVDSEKLAAEAEESATKPPVTPRRIWDSSKDESFASDAKGSGDVAEAMGAALDRVAKMIDEMHYESDDFHHDDALENGELIVGSTETEANDNANKGDDESEWSVVKSVGSNGTTESQQIAKAAEMLGSALFNSDMKNSAENSDVGSTFSVPSSVPTNATSHSHSAAQAQLDRWAAPLAQLRELGFDNESDCVEILERLAAANIGVDAETLNHVIDELCEKQNK